MAARIFKALIINFLIGYPSSCVTTMLLFYRKLKYILPFIIIGDFFLYGLLVITSATAFLILIKEVKEALLLSILSSFLLPIVASIVLLQTASSNRHDLLLYSVCVVVFMIVNSVVFLKIIRKTL